MNALNTIALNLRARIAHNSYALDGMNLLHDESGQDLIEYALIAGLIGIGAILSLKGLSTKIATAFNSVGTNLTSST